MPIWAVTCSGVRVCLLTNGRLQPRRATNSWRNAPRSKFALNEPGSCRSWIDGFIESTGFMLPPQRSRSYAPVSHGLVSRDAGFFFFVSWKMLHHRCLRRSDLQQVWHPGKKYRRGITFEVTCGRFCLSGCWLSSRCFRWLQTRLMARPRDQQRCLRRWRRISLTQPDSRPLSPNANA